MSNDSGNADGTIGWRVALDEFEVDHFCGSRAPDVGRDTVFDLSDHRDSRGLGIVLLPPSGTATGKSHHRSTASGCYLTAVRLTPVRFARDQLCTMSR